MMETDDSEEGVALDGSAAAAARLLGELAMLAGQACGSTPVLELMIGEIVTFASVAADGDCLTVAARLPSCGASGYLPAGAALAQRLARHGIECRWHADEGCHVAVRSVPLASLRSEQALMDAILDTADAAREWHAQLTC
ncbi:hypothetical protein ACFFTM_08725 [Pseudoduganella plicata]|uniref:Type III secretion system chaperone n=1 Tax=Pseudoduganella plicata TaxID=321984 RepID=A0A4P7BA50_9BURK|nr:hypothetical protein [Pseudoduganella plicata]QBQ35436.1 hypothetical protein E1742_04095 [Pseudoduganella plicata]GGZ01735.1 hypothetical protein GCM10007388_39330 [Pseudoduganella plicata]